MTLSRIADYREKIFKLKSKIKQALFYPVLIILTCIIMSLIMLIWVIPQFSELFKTAHCTLPFLTRCVLHLSDWIRTYYFVGIFPVISIALIYHYAIRYAKVRSILEYLLFNFPIFHIHIKLKMKRLNGG